ncbi:hypothetical protein BDV93DRAFT_518609 [Ceratobasidium sp. AG-I]|nr:hypothetical protein BDV93DRAFT_518609 [Ceratobasidium sp. AG-I]
MAETVYNFTVADTSPTIVYAPYVAGDSTTGGWESTCPTYVTNSAGQNSYMCDPDSAHTTSSFKASFQLSFEGVGVYLMGNTTGSLGYDVTLDGVVFPGNPRPDAGLLYSAIGLTPGQHSILVTVRQPANAANPGSVTFREAIVSAGTGRSGASVTKKVLDDEDPSIEYYAPTGGNWTIENMYTQAIGPEGISSTTFHDSYWTDATATVSFKGTGIFAYGACYSHSRFAAYSASVDGAAETSFDGTINLYSTNGVVKQRAGNCLRYFKTDLDGTQDHKLVLRVKDAGRLAVDWVEVVSVSGGVPSDGGSGGAGITSTPINSTSKVPILAGAIAGGVVLCIAILTLLLCLRRRRTNYDPTATVAQHEQPATPYASTPFVPGLHQPQPQMQNGPYSVPITPPWPQPQTPGPGYATPGMLAAGLGTRTSFASSGAPLISPGLASTYSGGSGWPGASTHRSESFNSGGGSSSTPGAEQTAFRPMNVGRPSLEGQAGYFTTNVPSTASGSMSGYGGSNVAVEAGGGSNRVPEPGSKRYDISSPASPAPPAYDQGGYAPAAGAGQKRR